MYRASTLMRSLFTRELLSDLCWQREPTKVLKVWGQNWLHEALAVAQLGRLADYPLGVFQITLKHPLWLSCLSASELEFS